MELSKIILIVVITFSFVLLFMPIIIQIAHHIGALDIPNERKIHTKPMPRLGGLGIYSGFLLGYLLFGQMTYMMNAILISSFVIIISGIIDDIKSIKAYQKLLCQFIAALIVVLYGGILLDDINIFGLYINFGIFAYPITILFILGCINCMNLIDGLDGLAGGISSIFFLFIGIIAFVQGQRGLNYELAITLTFIMFGSTTGFLFHNFYPAKIFMGDSGSMFLGFIISIITILGFKSVMMSSLAIPLFILVVPILDTVFAIIRRRLKGENVMTTADRSHIHHQFLRQNFTQRQTVLMIYIITFMFSFASLIYTLINQKLGMIVYGCLMIIFVILIFKTDIIFEKNGKDKEDKK